MSEPFVGEIALFGFIFPPRSWAKCDGQFLQISQNSALFSLLGTIYGGNGETNFRLPDLRGRTPIHQGSAPGLPTFTLGSVGGAVNTTLSIDNMPAHSHPADLMATTVNADKVDPVDSALALAREDTYSATAADTAMDPGSIDVGNTGGGQSFSNMQPHLVLNWCIALQGIYPSPD